MRIATAGKRDRRECTKAYTTKASEARSRKTFSVKSAESGEDCRSRREGTKGAYNTVCNRVPPSTQRQDLPLYALVNPV